MPLTKQAALEYLAGKHVPVTAKVLSIDLDSRASTASELLERMTAQGLAERDPTQRPREYALTEAGRRQVKPFSSHVADPFATPLVHPAGEATTSECGIESGPQRVESSANRLDSLRAEVKKRIDAQEIVTLYRATHKLRALAWHKNKTSTLELIAEIEAKVGKDTAQRIRRLVDLERELGLTNQLPETLKIRTEFGLSADVFG